MSVPIPLRGDFASAWLRGLAKKTKSRAAGLGGSLVCCGDLWTGATRTEAAKIGGVGLQIIRDWVLRFNARGPDGLLDPANRQASPRSSMMPSAELSRR